MKSAKSILQELGFRPGASESTQRAFLRHLSKAANLVDTYKHEEKDKQSVPRQQLCFDSELLGHMRKPGI
jgi:hypothetical protein